MFLKSISVLLCKRFYSHSQFGSVAQILEARNYGHKFLIKGWLKAKRSHAGQTFLHIEDGSSFERLQVVVPADVSLKDNLTYHACLSIEGHLEKSLGKNQVVDLKASNVEVISPGAPMDYPFVERGNYLLEDFRQIPHFRSRLKRFSSMFKIRSQVKMSMRDYFEKEDFVSIDTPVITTNDCEGNGNAFSVKGHGFVKPHKTHIEVGDLPFGVPVFMTVSGQFHLESVLSGLSRVYNCNPAFRIEGDSRMHLSEFWMIEAEEILDGDRGYSSLLDRMEDFVKFVIEETIRKSPDDLKYQWLCNKKTLLTKQLESALKNRFIRLEHSEAMKILNENRKRLNNDPPAKLNRECELFLTKHCGDIPVFVTDWPIHTKPFYMLTNDERNTCYGVDLLVPGVGEIAGGGLREHRFETLRDKVDARKLSEELGWYVDLRRWGYCPSGGFGLGLERLLQYMLGVDHAHDVIPFPRSDGRCKC